ncbi:hypothetical protein GobsT_06590 [Gemmata obscuriglobus]|uniref:Uncharacterized protein n=1 Tax=Gemmata obscuriglobus TaxID=114 RepID=A0A2Z3HG63_9BACT|nr:hypothetical protein [Gemmata obscuriglobus]AWM40794.1 hypothetical protein C1280_29945 [Gemmata obscuriglobus]QEG25924.1 hypothetical protein GobsT_06590 [Gemmata obscuriglobus]VTS00052.1 unnamed protein product [Gemmata obscuriglobus UQM 2246]
MSLVVPCPGCPAQLSAPESAAGKQIRCPKCKAVATVPAFLPVEEVPVVEAKVAAPVPKPKVQTTISCCVVCNTMVAVLAKVKVVHCPKCGFANPVRGWTDDGDEDEAPRRQVARRNEGDEDDRPRKKKRRADDDDYEDDDRPRRRRRRSVSRGGGSGRVVALVVGGLVLLGGLALGGYLLVGPGGVLAARAPVPPGWKQYDYPQSGFRAAFPGEPTVFGANVPGGFGGGPLPGGGEIPQLESMFSYRTGGLGAFGVRGQSGTQVIVEVHRYRTSIPRASRDLMTRTGYGRFTGGSSNRVRWLGSSAFEMVMGGTLVRMVVLEKAVIVVQISGPNGVRARPEEENGFFDNFELTQ